MKPYDREFILEKLNEYNNKIKCDKVGSHEIIKRDGLQGIIDGYLYSLEDNIDIDILELKTKDKYWMRLTPKEIESTYFIVKSAYGKVGVVGLGLGYTVEEIAKKSEVSEVLVYEFSEDVIELYKRNFGDNPKVKIIKGDAYRAKGEEFDYFFVDIYEYKITDKVVDDYKYFNELHKIKDYVFWGVEHFLLSCSYEEIVWVFIPELWMDLSKKIFEGIQEAGYLETYKQLEADKVSDILEKFKVVLNSDMD